MKRVPVVPVVTAGTGVPGGSGGAGRAAPQSRVEGRWDGLRAEWTKVRTSPGTFGLLLVAVATTVALSVLAAATVPCTAAACGTGPAGVSLTGVTLGQAVIAVLAVSTIGGEYGTGMLRTTFTAMPHRVGVLATKATVLAGLVASAAVVAVLVSLLAGRQLMAGRHGPSLSLSDGPVLRAVGGSVLYLVLVGLLSLGIATVVRGAAAAGGIVLTLLYVFPIVARAVPDPDWQRHLLQIGPMTAGLSIQATAGLDDLPIGPWAGLGVLGVWAVGALLVGAVVLARRDA